MVQLKTKEFERIISQRGWHKDRQKNHITYKHSQHKEIISIPNHKGQCLSAPLVARLLKLIGMTEKELINAR